MDLELRENALCVMPCSVLADLESAGNGLVGTSLAQQFGHLCLAAGQTELFAQIRLIKGVSLSRYLQNVLLLESPAVLSELVD